MPRRFVVDSEPAHLCRLIRHDWNSPFQVLLVARSSQPAAYRSMYGRMRPSYMYRAERVMAEN